MTIEIYPGAAREYVDAGEHYSVFDESALPFLEEFGLSEAVKNPSKLESFLGVLTNENVFPGISHLGGVRVYLLGDRERGPACVVKPFPDYYHARSGLDHIGTQELLHAAFHNTPSYAAARVFGHIGVSKDNGAGYALVEYVNAPTFRQAEGPINHTNTLTRAITRPIVYMQHHKDRKAMLPQHTNLGMYIDLIVKARDVRDRALAEFGVALPAKVEFGRFAGCGNWDYNPDNLLCTVNEQGEPSLTVIDQGADLSPYVASPL